MKTKPLRGGSWYSFPVWVRSAYRFGNWCDFRVKVIGLRLVKRRKK